MDRTVVARPGEDLSGRTGVSRESRLERREGALGVGPVLVLGRNLGVRGETPVKMFHQFTGEIPVHRCTNFR